MRLLVAVYALFALAAGARSGVQLATRAGEAPAAYALSALAAALYLVAAVALHRGALRLARAVLLVELAGVLAVGTASLAAPSAFPDETVWSAYGLGYGLVPLVLPLAGLAALARHVELGFPNMAAMTKGILPALLVGAALIAGCGSDEEEPAASAPAAERQAAAEPGLGAIKRYLLDHTEQLAASTGALAEQGRAYHALAERAGFDYARLLGERRAEVRGLVEEMQATWRQANPQYEEMEGVVAGVPELADFDVIIDAGSDASDPESAVPFDVRLPDGRVLEQPGNFFFLTETSLFGTNEDFQARGVRPDLDGDGEVAFGEALPDANVVLGVTRDFARQARELQAAARAWRPRREDAFQALVTMTPTMSEYFGQWKDSRFIAGADASEDAFAASSRLQDIEDILSGLVLIYDNIRPVVAEADPAQAEQTGRDLEGLRDFAADLRRREERGTRFDAEQADALGAEAQARAEAIAGQVAQAAGQLGIELES